MSDLDSRQDPPARPFAIILALCVAMALFEGFDIQSMGVAAPRLAPAFHLKPGLLGFILSASTFGLMIGAAVGGWLSDRIGRKIVLVGAMAVLGVFSILTAMSANSTALIVARIFAGVGLGGAFPNLIALITEAAPTRFRASALGLMYGGLPFGGAVAGLVAGGLPDWQRVFWVGGAGPLLLVPVIFWGLPAAPAARALTANPAPAVATDPFGRLFGPRAPTTMLLWASYFLTLFAVYIQLNWMPTFLRAKGLTLGQAALSSVLLNLGAVIGSLILGLILDRVRPRRVPPFTYAGAILSLLALAATDGASLLAVAFFAGLFLIGGQLTLYALAPMLYAIEVRGTGVGAAVSAGRAGAIAGPVLAGLTLAQGFGPNAIPLIAEPGLMIAVFAVMWAAAGTSKPQTTR